MALGRGCADITVAYFNIFCCHRGFKLAGAAVVRLTATSGRPCVAGGEVRISRGRRCIDGYSVAMGRHICIRKAHCFCTALLAEAYTIPNVNRETAPEVVDWTLAFYNAHGKTAIRLKKEVPGHLVNRLQAAIWREAIDAVVSGVASVEDVDKAIAYGPGLRWALMGPHQIFHLAGGPGGMRNFLEHFGPNIENWWRDMRDVTLTPEVKATLIAGVDDESAGRSVETLAAERDERLLDLLDMLKRAR